MNRRDVPYPSPGYSVIIPDAVWDSALGTLRDYGARGGSPSRPGSEGLVYLGGVVAGPAMIVTGVYLIEHDAQGDQVVLTDTEARWLVRALRSRDEKLIAQVHTHRGVACHSHGDDVHATSFHDGFISIVAPHFARNVTAIEQCAVLEFREGVFCPLIDTDVQRRVVVYPQELRRKIIPSSQTTTIAEERPWKSFGRRLRRIGPKRRSREMG